MKKIKYRITYFDGCWYAQDIETGKIIRKLFY